MHKAEILAPCGSFESVVAAANSGADAVYFGLKSFSARANAKNFDEEEMKNTIVYLKQRGMKSYLTLNTLFFDEEKEALLESARAAVHAGIDGIIVQDLGLYAILREIFPTVQLHASTQLSVQSLAGVKEAQNLAFNRVVLARELNKEQILKIKQNTTIELEVFTHGALCVSVSGNCYVSSMIGTRSGNRGRCAQTCRLPFSIGDKKPDSYSLSLKDLSLIHEAREMEQMGITSLKIEGRQKRPEYVAAVTDALYSELETGSHDEARLHKVFSRSGFTSGYFDNNFSDMFGVRTKENVLETKETLKEISSAFRKEKKRFAVNFSFSVNLFSGATLTAQTGNYISQTTAEVTKAQNKPLEYSQVEKSFSKLGDTPFYLGKLDFETDNESFLSASQLNEMRRAVLQDISQQMSAIAKVEEHKLSPLKAALPAENTALAVRFEKFQQIDFGLLKNFKFVTVTLEEYIKHSDAFVKVIDKIILELPYTLFENEEKVLEQLIAAKEKGVTRTQANNLAHIYLSKQAGLDFCVDWRLNTLNSHAAQYLENLGAKQITLSAESSLSNAKRVKTTTEKGVIIYGHLPVMTYRVCPIKSDIGCETCKGKGQLTDRKGNKFPVMCSNEAAFLYNPQPIYLPDRLDELHGMHFGTLYFSLESKDECNKIINDYLQGKKQKEKGSYTRGLLYRKVQ